LHELVQPEKGTHRGRRDPLLVFLREPYQMEEKVKRELPGPAHRPKEKRQSL